MVWVSGAKLAAASANEGMLGVIGAGSMPAELLKKQIQKAKKLSSGSLAVNVPLLYEKIEEQLKVALAEDIKFLFAQPVALKNIQAF